jgi:hypothetical protein
MNAAPRLPSRRARRSDGGPNITAPVWLDEDTINATWLDPAWNLTNLTVALRSDGHGISRIRRSPDSLRRSRHRDDGRADPARVSLASFSRSGHELPKGLAAGLNHSRQVGSRRRVQGSYA